MLTSVLADTAGALGDALARKQNKKTNRKVAVSQSRKDYKSSNKADWEHFWAPFEGKWEKSYGTSKLVSYPLHTVYGGVKFGLKTALDAGRRGLLTLPARTGNLFLKKEEKITLWSGEK